MVNKANKSIFLCSRDDVLREFTREKNVVEIWVKLKQSNMTKLLAHKLFQKQQPYSFQMEESKSIVKKLT